MMALTDFNLSPKAKKAIKDAKFFAESRGDSLIRNEHLIYGCLKNVSDRVYLIFENRGISSPMEKYEEAIKDFSKDHEGYFVRRKNENSWHSELNECLECARWFASSNDDDFIASEHLLYVLLDLDDLEFNGYLLKYGLDTEYLKGLIDEVMADPNLSRRQELKNGEYDTGSRTNQSNPNHKSSDNAGFPHIEKYCKNINQSVIFGQIPPITSRDAEISEMIEVLSKKNKGNVVLTGEAGVGKTAIVEGLTQKIVDGDVPSHMSVTQLLSLDITAMIAGTKYRGEFEERIKCLVEELSGQEAILFIDEIHNIVGAGSTQKGAMDASNILKPALARGDIRCIGATTSDEYSKIFGKDSALKRRFEKIEVSEPTKEQTKLMLNHSLEHYEKYHSVKFSKKNIDDILNYCHTYMPNKRFPDKAFDILDQVGAKTKIKNDLGSEKVKIIKSEFNDLMSHDPSEDEFAISIENYIKSLVEVANDNSLVPNVHKSDILEVFEKKTGLPQKVLNESNKCFSLFSKTVKKDVFGQDEIIDRVYDALSCARTGLNDPKKPLANFLFVGPTSVGKTFTAKKIAKHFYGNEKSFIQINMSEYQDKTGVSKLIGANAGYVGYEEGGILTGFVRNNPNCVVLFDEIEKSDPKILDLLLHLLDEGYVSDNFNREVDFSKAVVILTTNIGHDQAGKRSMGFVNDNISEEESYKGSLKKHLRPELIARLDNICVFNNLNDKILSSIIDSSIKTFSSKLKGQNISVSIHRNVKQFILNKIKSENLNARNVKTLITRLVQSPTAKFIVQNRKVEKISIKVVDKEIKVS